MNRPSPCDCERVTATLGSAERFVSWEWQVGTTCPLPGRQCMNQLNSCISKLRCISLIKSSLVCTVRLNSFVSREQMAGDDGRAEKEGTRWQGLSIPQTISAIHAYLLQLCFPLCASVQELEHRKRGHQQSWRDEGNKDIWIWYYLTCMIPGASNPEDNWEIPVWPLALILVTFLPHSQFCFYISLSKIFRLCPLPSLYVMSMRVR